MKERIIARLMLFAGSSRVARWVAARIARDLDDFKEETMSKTFLRSMLLFALLGLVFGCSDDDDDPVTPATGLTGTFSINDGALVTDTPEVTLFHDVADADSMRFRNDGDDWTAWAPTVAVGKATTPWTLAGDDGMKTVQAEFKTTGGKSLALEDDIELDAVGPQVLILEDDGTEDAMATILTGAGCDVTMGGLYYDYVETDFSAYDLVILLYGVDYGYGIDSDVQQGLKDFVQAGGVLLTTEWLTYQGTGETDWATLIDLLPLAYDDDYCDNGAGECVETYTKLVDHAVTEGLPATFSTPGDWVYSFQVVNATSVASNIQVLFEGSISGAALGIGDFGTGHVLHWSMGGEYEGSDIWSTETSRILTNIADFSE